MPTLSPRSTHRSNGILSVLPRTLCCLFLLLFLTGCQEQFYTGLAEQDANEILALLLDRGVDARKEAGEKGTWNLTVERDQIAGSMDLLEKNGLPRTRYDNMGKIFKKDGIISSPLEEKARFIYALSQEVAGTIAQIDGVLAARVHLVLQEEDALGERITPASASIFIKHRRDVEMLGKTRQIKKLVENSIQGLKYESISAFLFPASPPIATNKLPYASVAGLHVAPDSVNTVQLLFAAIALLLCLLGASCFHLYKRKQDTVTEEA